MVEVLRLVLGSLVLWAPGLTWTWALAPELDWAKFLSASVIVALTVQPGLMFLGNVFFGVPVTAMNVVLLSLALAALGAAWALGPHVERMIA